MWFLLGTKDNQKSKWEEVWELFIKWTKSINVTEVGRTAAIKKLLVRFYRVITQTHYKRQWEDGKGAKV